MNKLSIQKATVEDAVWIIDELRKGAIAGHFSDSLLDEQQRTGMIVQVLLKSELPILKLRNGNAKLERLPACLWVAHFDGKPAGYLLSLREETSKSNSSTGFWLSILGIKRKPCESVELLLGGTVHKLRGKGVFTELIKYQLELTRKGTRVYARCYPQSTTAIAILKSQGLQITQMGNPIELAITL